MSYDDYAQKTSAVLECFDGGFVAVETVCTTTRELIQSQVAWDLDALHDQSLICSIRQPPRSRIAIAIPLSARP
jgi:hypothetical protein